MKTYYSLGEMEVVRNEKDDEIERLRAENAQLRTSLQGLLTGVIKNVRMDRVAFEMILEAIAALGEEKKG